MSLADWLILFGDIAALMTGTAGLISAWRGHNAINNQIRPQLTANSRAVVRVAQESSPEVAAQVKEIVNGGAASAHPAG